jgi:hypothetical protein
MVRLGQDSLPNRAKTSGKIAKTLFYPLLKILRLKIEDQMPRLGSKGNKTYVIMTFILTRMNFVLMTFVIGTFVTRNFVRLMFLPKNSLK